MLKLTAANRKNTTLTTFLLRRRSAFARHATEQPIARVFNQNVNVGTGLATIDLVSRSPNRVASGRANDYCFFRNRRCSGYSLEIRNGIHVQVLVRDNNVDQALRALKKKMQREGIFREMKMRDYYEKPSQKRAREKAEAVRRVRKLARKRAQREGMVTGGRTAAPAR